MSGGRVELGLGAGWYDAEHTAYGIPFPAAGRALRPARGAAGDHQRPLGDARRRDVLLRRPHYPVVGSPALPKPRAAAARRRSSSVAAASARTPALPPRYADEFNVPFAPRAVAGDSTGCAAACERSPAATLRLLRRAGRVRAARDEAEVTRRAAAIGRDAGRAARERGWPARPPRWSTGSARSPRSARRGSTSRCSTWPTSTTSSSSPPRSPASSEPFPGSATPWSRRQRRVHRSPVLAAGECSKNTSLLWIDPTPGHGQTIAGGDIGSSCPRGGDPALTAKRWTNGSLPALGPRPSVQARP